MSEKQRGCLGIYSEVERLGLKRMLYCENYHERYAEYEVIYNGKRKNVCREPSIKNL